MKIKIVINADIPKWLALSHEHDCYVKELVADLTEWYNGNDNSPSYDSYMQSKIDKKEAFMAVASDNDCMGIIAISKRSNRITFFAISHNADMQTIGYALINCALELLDNSKPIYINEIASISERIRSYKKLFLNNGFIYHCDSLENGVPVETFVKQPSQSD